MSAAYSDGVRLAQDSFDALPAQAVLRPLRDQLIVEPLPWPFSETLQVIYGGRALRGRVLAAGKGCYPNRYNGPKGQRSKMWSSLYFRPCDVKVGDIVQLGGLSLRGYLFPTFRWGDKTCVVCREEDVTVIEESHA